jgi:hypothetical protein
MRNPQNGHLILSSGSNSFLHFRHVYGIFINSNIGNIGKAKYSEFTGGYFYPLAWNLNRLVRCIIYILNSKAPEANLVSHLRHCQTPFACRFTATLEHEGHL